MVLIDVGNLTKFPLILWVGFTDNKKDGPRGTTGIRLLEIHYLVGMGHKSICIHS